MGRYLWIAVAVVSGLAGALLLVTGPTVSVGGREQTCAGIVVDSERGASTYEDPATAAACDRAETRWAWYAAGAGLISLVVGTGVYFRSPRRPEVRGTRRESIDNR